MCGKISAVSLIYEVEDVPPLPSIYNKVAQLVDREETTAADLARIIRQDQSLTVRILRAANISSRFRAGAATNITRAIVSMGFRAVKATVMAASVLDSFKKYLNASNIDAWRHAYGVGSIARSLAVQHKIGEPEEAFVLGLIHDLGGMLLKSQFPEEVEQVLQQMPTSEHDLQTMENAVLGVDHAMAGYLLTRRWRLPEMVVQVTRHHHDPAQSGDFKDLASIIHLSDTLAVAMGYGSNGDPNVRPLKLDEETVEDFGLASAIRLEPVCGESKSAFDGFDSFFRFSQQTGQVAGMHVKRTA